MSDDLDDLVSQLNAEAPRAADSDEATERLNGWLEEVVARGGSDLLLVAGAPPSVRIDGLVRPLDPIRGGPLDSEEIDDAVRPALPPHARRDYRERGIADASYRVGELGRFRINLHH